MLSDLQILVLNTTRLQISQSDKEHLEELGSNELQFDIIISMLKLDLRRNIR